MVQTNQSNKQRRLKEALRQNQVLQLGGWVTLGHPGIAEIMARSGFDWVCVDLEHSMMDLNQAGQLIQVIDATGCVPLVRLSSLDAVQIKRVMDHGARGVIVPMVNSLDDVNAIVDAMYYPPKGKRGVGLARAQQYGAGFLEYRDNHQDESILVVQIEHIDAVAHIDAILSCPEVDAFIIGPYDLSASMGMAGQFNHPEFLKARQTIYDAAARINKCGGIHIVEPDPEALARAMADGSRFIAYSVDIRILDVTCRSAIKRIKK